MFCFRRHSKFTHFSNTVQGLNILLYSSLSSSGMDRKDLKEDFQMCKIIPFAGALNWHPIVEPFAVGFTGFREFEIVEIVR